MYMDPLYHHYFHFLSVKTEISTLVLINYEGSEILKRKQYILAISNVAK